MRARLVPFLLAATLGAASASAADRHEIGEHSLPAFAPHRSARPMIAPPRAKPFRDAERRSDHSQFLAFCCMAATAPPEAEIISLPASATTPPAPETEPGRAPPAAASDAPLSETVGSVTIMRGAVTHPPGH